ncbi:PorT family protein [Ilyomonas limi]|uniref:PorT family protein n=1 Tax=Ilyomonas limi TaxID=2575867 RepID=A0A4U3L2Z3_9BACT|nr:outer membrane beta-barrel protein [Ilyomonas limi]TKK69252.1 PorT family protein [Ilyomonas limi]
MRKRCILLMSMLFTFPLFKSDAQDLQNYIGIKGGISIPNLTAGSNNPINTSFRSRLGPDAAIFWEQAIAPNFAIVPGIAYSSQGGKRNGYQAFPFPEEYAGFFPPGEVPEYLYANFDNEIKLDYLMLNVLARFNWHLGESSPVMLYAEVGPFAGYLITAKDVASGSGIVYKDAQMQEPLITSAISFNNTMDIKDQAHKGNVGVAGDVGVAYYFPSGKIFIEAGGNYGMLNIQKDPANGKNGIGALIGRVGYAFSLGRGY